MKEKSTLMLVSAIIGIPAMVGFIWFAGWGAGVCLFLALWANNMSVGARHGPE